MQILRKDLSIKWQQSSQSENLISNPTTEKRQQGHLRQLFFLPKDRILLLFDNSYLIHNLETNRTVSIYNFPFIAEQFLPIILDSEPDHYRMLVLVTEPFKQLILLQKDLCNSDNQTQISMKVLYDFQNQPAKYDKEVAPSFLVNYLSGYCCLLRKFSTETLVIVYQLESKKGCSRVKQFFINEQCLTTYDNLGTLVNNRQVMTKNILKVSLRPMWGQKQDSEQKKRLKETGIKHGIMKMFSKEVEVSIQFENEEKGIVYFVGRVSRDLMLVAVNGTVGTTLVLFDPFKEEIINKVKRQNLLLELNLLSFSAQEVLINQYFMDENRVAKIRLVVVGAEKLQDIDGENIQIEDDKIMVCRDLSGKRWVRYGESIQGVADISQYSILSVNTARFFVIKKYLDALGIKENQFVEEVYRHAKVQRLEGNKQPCHTPLY